MWEELKQWAVNEGSLYAQANFESIFIISIILVLSTVFGYAYANPLGRMLRLNRTLAMLLGTAVFFGLFSFGVEQLLLR